MSNCFRKKKNFKNCNQKQLEGQVKEAGKITFLKLINEILHFLVSFWNRRSMDLQTLSISYCFKPW